MSAVLARAVLPNLAAGEQIHSLSHMNKRSGSLQACLGTELCCKGITMFATHAPDRVSLGYCGKYCEGLKLGHKLEHVQQTL